MSLVREWRHPVWLNLRWLPFRSVKVSACVLHGKNNYGKEIFFKMNYGYPKIELWISLNQIIMDIQKRIMDIQKSNYGYP